MLNMKNLSDKTVQIAVEEYDGAIAAGVDKRRAMKIAIEMAMFAETKERRKPAVSSDAGNIGGILFVCALITVAAFVLGVAIRTIN